MKFGVHVSIAGSLDKAVDRASNIDCDTFQIFTRNPRGWIAKELLPDNIISFKRKVLQTYLSPIFVHVPYLPNLASPDSEMWEKSLNVIKNELIRCDLLDIPFIITHLGSPKSAGIDFGISRVISSLNKIFHEYDGRTIILLENSTGKNNSLGKNLLDICKIISQVDFPDFLGVCFDTCHAFASGYDIRQMNIVDSFLDDINSSIGLSKLLCIHCNDSLFDLREYRDRHEHLGLGKIGKKGFENLLLNKRTRDIPFICETPVDDRRNDQGNLDFLRNLAKELKLK
ncbi:MAG TPA: deoxyribonuclease IV [candidate division Zixibacteria bacterium]|nr:deoxyribonuclease IV [candidate division Zixibacteria bacterium]